MCIFFSLSGLCFIFYRYSYICFSMKIFECLVSSFFSEISSGLVNAHVMYKLHMEEDLICKYCE